MHKCRTAGSIPRGLNFWSIIQWKCMPARRGGSTHNPIYRHEAAGKAIHKACIASNEPALCCLYKGRKRVRCYRDGKQVPTSTKTR
jgi:hypothetical protein